MTRHRLHHRLAAIEARLPTPPQPAPMPTHAWDLEQLTYPDLARLRALILKAHGSDRLAAVDVSRADLGKVVCLAQASEAPAGALDLHRLSGAERTLLAELESRATAGAS